MKTMVLLSDSHGHASGVRALSRIFAENDYVVHLGDGSSDMRPFSAPNVYVMKGNCDFSFGLPEKVLNIEGVSVLCCHGHRYGVKSSLDRLVAHARELGCTVALYGHTHRAAIEEREGVLCVNPGALASFSEPSYAYLVFHNGKVVPTVVPVQP